MTRVTVTALLAASLFVLAGYSPAQDSSDAAVYDAKVKFTIGRTLRFPAFALTYVGKRHVTPRQYPRGWWTYDFKVRGKGDEQTVSWSAGAGDIGPTRFKVDGAEFQLELSHSDKHGTLRENEMVVSLVK